MGTNPEFVVVDMTIVIGEDANDINGDVAG